MKLTLNLEIDAPKRLEIERRMSDSMGQFIEGVGDYNLENWTIENWRRMVATLFDVAAVEILRARVGVLGSVQEIPFDLAERS